MTFMVVFMRHSESVIRGAILSTRESGVSISGAKSDSRGDRRSICNSAGRFTSSRTLSTGRTDAEPTPSRTGTEGGFYRQVAPKPPAQSASGSSTGIDQRLGCDRFRSPTSTPLTPWLERRTARIGGGVGTTVGSPGAPKALASLRTFGAQLRTTYFIHNSIKTIQL